MGASPARRRPVEADAAAADERAPIFLASAGRAAELSHELEAAGQVVAVARRADHARRRFEQSAAMVALVDCTDEVGIGLLRTLAPTAEKRGAALIALVPQHDTAAELACLKAGATHYHLTPPHAPGLSVAIEMGERYVRRLRSSEKIAAVVSAQARLTAGPHWQWRKGDTHLTASPAFAELMGAGVGQERLPVAALLERIDPPDRDDFIRGVARTLRAGMSGDLEHRLLVDGSLHTIAHHLRVLRDAKGRLTGLAATVEDLDAALLDRRLSAHFDLLTGLANAAFARDWIDQLLGGRSDCDPASIVLLLSISRFDGINAAYGRVVADALLQAAARRVRRVVGADQPDTLLVARMGGAEFAVCFAGPVQVADVVLLAERLGEAFNQPFLVSGKVVHLACRIGIAVGEADLDGADTLLRRASAALAQAKARELNRYEVLASHAPEDLAARMASLGDDLRADIDIDAFDLLFQPQVDLRTGAIDGVEALTRWRHRELGTLSPETLMDVAGAAELTPVLGRHLLLKGLAEAQAWPERLRSLRLSVNFTAEDMALPDFAESVAAALAETGFPPGRLTVEVTESNMMRNVDHAARALGQLRAHGVRIAIDDFGTGYSSLAYLRALPLDYLKIDKRLLADLTGPESTQVVVRGVVEMARSLGLKVIAEGVETSGQREAARLAGCDLYQGFLCSPPITGAALATLFERWTTPEQALA